MGKKKSKIQYLQCPGGMLCHLAIPRLSVRLNLTLHFPASAAEVNKGQEGCGRAKYGVAGLIPATHPLQWIFRSLPHSIGGSGGR